MAPRTLNPKLLENVSGVVSNLIKLPTHRLWTDYDAEADVLYLSFERPQQATDSFLRDDGILVRYRDEKLVGITIFDASTR